MSAVELLAVLHERGIEVFRDGDKLRYRSPAGAIDDGLRRTVQEHRDELLEIIAVAETVKRLFPVDP